VVYRRSSAQAQFTEVVGSPLTPATLTFVDNSVASNTTYVYYVAARHVAEGETSEMPSNTVSVTTNPLQGPSLFLHGTGSATNPSSLFLDGTAPTATTPKQKDSAAINFNKGNPWADIGTWTAQGTSTVTPTALDTWIGLKNSGDTNTAFDLRAEVYQNNTTLVASGESRCIKGVRNGVNLAKLVSVTLAPGTINGTLSLTLRTRIGTNPDGTRCSGTDASHSNAAGLRVYFDSVSRASKLQ
jgi:hypothetical protein